MLKMVSLALLTSCAAAYAQDAGSVRFLNLTASEITSLKLSPVAKRQPVNKQDLENKQDLLAEQGYEGKEEKPVTPQPKEHLGSVGYNKPLAIANVEPGVYDVKFRDKLNRECVLKNVALKGNATISIEEKKLVGHCKLL